MSAADFPPFLRALHFPAGISRVSGVWRTPFLLALAILAGTGRAEPLSKKIDVDFFRDVPSRNLKGLAARSDGRLVAGPTLTEIAAPAPADLLWCLEPAGSPDTWLLGTGPDGRVLELAFDPARATYAARLLVKLDDPQVFALKRLPGGSVLAGTSPRGAVYLIQGDKPVARIGLPVDSIFDFVLQADGSVLAATGNPGRIYRIDVPALAAGGVQPDKVTDTAALAARGVTVFGEIRDRNVRRIVSLPDGRIVAGSAPRGNVYAFPAAGGAPVILQENRDAEVTDLLPQPNGDVFATVVFSNTVNESRISSSAAAAKRERDAKEDNTPPPAQAERFGGRSALLLFPAAGFPETLTARANAAFYRLARRGDLLIVAGGEQGELVGYDLKARLSLTFAGSVSSQLNALVPLPSSAGGEPDRFLILRNNAPGLALLDFTAGGPREAESRRLDLGTPSQVGALRFNRLRNVGAAAIAPEIRASNGSDDLEGWGPWTRLESGPDGGWRADGVRGRYVKLRLRIAEPAPPAPAPGWEIDRAALFGLPQNRRPQLQEFRVLTPNFGVVPAPEPAPPVSVSLSQLLQGPKDDTDRRRSSFLSSQVVPSPGAQVILWTLADPDGDNLLSTFSIRRDGDAAWIDLVASSRDNHAQFDTRNLPDGVYFTRLIAAEAAPRPLAERLAQTFETDDLIVDHTPPEVLDAAARRNGDTVVVTVRGRDRLSLLDGIEVVFNNGVRETVEQPADGIRDGREETFTLEVPLARVSNATSLEVTLYDAAGNAAARRLSW
jgi:hypothetical protein